MTDVATMAPNCAGCAFWRRFREHERVCCRPRRLVKFWLPFGGCSAPDKAKAPDQLMEQIAALRPSFCGIAPKNKICFIN